MQLQIKKTDYSKAISWSNVYLSSMIIILHTDVPSGIADYTPALLAKWDGVKEIINVICDVAVPAFFIISAYLMFRKYNFKSYYDILKTKIRTLAIPYLIWSFIGILYHWILASYKSDTFSCSLLDLVQGTYNQPLWFIKTLFCYVIISPIIYWIVCRSKFSIIVCFVAVIANLLFDFGYTSIFFWFASYFLGAWIGVYKHSDVEKHWVKANIFDNILFLIICYIVIFTFGVITVNTKLYYLYRNISGLLFVYHMWRISWKNTPDRNLQCSFYAFCSHCLLLGVVPRICHMILPNTFVGLLLAYILSVLFIMVIIMASSYLLRKYFASAYNILVGGRKERV